MSICHSPVAPIALFTTVALSGTAVAVDDLVIKSHSAQSHSWVLDAVDDDLDSDTTPQNYDTSANARLPETGAPTVENDSETATNYTLIAVGRFYAYSKSRIIDFPRLPGPTISLGNNHATAQWEATKDLPNARMFLHVSCAADNGGPIHPEAGMHATLSSPALAETHKLSAEWEDDQPNKWSVRYYQGNTKIWERFKDATFTEQVFGTTFTLDEGETAQTTVESNTAVDSGAEDVTFTVESNVHGV